MSIVWLALPTRRPEAACSAFWPSGTTSTRRLTASESWGQDLIWIFLGVVGGALLGVVALTCWSRYHDQRIRDRLRATRHTEFVPPSEESFTS